MVGGDDGMRPVARRTWRGGAGGCGRRGQGIEAARAAKAVLQGQLEEGSCWFIRDFLKSQ